MDFPRQHRRPASSPPPTGLHGFPSAASAAAASHSSPSAQFVGYPLLKNMARSELHLMGEISAVRGHFPGAQSGRPSPWYQGLDMAGTKTSAKAQKARRAELAMMVSSGLEQVEE